MVKVDLVIQFLTSVIAMNLGTSPSFLDMPSSRDMSAGKKTVAQIPSTVFPTRMAQKLDVQTTMTVVKAARKV